MSSNEMKYNVKVTKMPRVDSIIKEVFENNKDSHIVIRNADRIHSAEAEQNAREAFQRFVITKVLEGLEFQLVEVATGE